MIMYISVGISTAVFIFTYGREYDDDSVLADLFIALCAGLTWPVIVGLLLMDFWNKVND
jgi:hypothetical protein